MGKQYISKENNEPNMAIRQFRWQIDDNNSVELTWEWPIDRSVRFALVFELSDEDSENPDLDVLLNEGYPHEVVVRDLVTGYTANIAEGRRRFLVCPAYFDKGQTVVAYTPYCLTDWMHKKTVVSFDVVYKPLALSHYKYATLRVTVSESSQVPLVCQIMKYVIYENGRALGHYPLDAMVMSGQAGFYVRKDQVVKYSLDESYSHLLVVRSR